MPCRPVVQGHVGSGLGAGVEHAAAGRVLSNDSREVVGCDAAGDLLPRSAVVAGLVEVRLEVIQLVARRGHVGRRRVVRRKLNSRDERPFGQLLRRDIGPRPTAVPREVNQSVVRPSPEHSALVARFGEREDGPVVLGARRIPGYRATRRLHLRDVVSGEVRAYGLPAGALVRRSKQHVAGAVEDVWVVGTKEDRERPLEAVFEVLGTPSPIQLRPDRDNAGLAGTVVVTQQHATAARGAPHGTRIDNVRVIGPHGDVATFRAADRVTVPPDYSALVRAAGHANGAVVLLRAVHAIGEPSVGGEVIELGGGLVVDGGPRVATVERHAGPAIVALDHAARAPWVDPQIVVVAVRRGQLGEGTPAIARPPGLDVEHVDGLGVARVGEDVAVVPRP